MSGCRVQRQLVFEESGDILSVHQFDGGEFRVVTERGDRLGEVDGLGGFTRADVEDFQARAVTFHTVSIAEPFQVDVTLVVVMALGTVGLLVFRVLSRVVLRARMAFQAG